MVLGRPRRQDQAAVPGHRSRGRPREALERMVVAQGWEAGKPYSTRPRQGGRGGREAGGRELLQRYIVEEGGRERREWREDRREGEDRRTEDRQGPRWREEREEKQVSMREKTGVRRERSWAGQGWCRSRAGSRETSLSLHSLSRASSSPSV